MIPNDETGYSFVRPFSRFSSANFSRDPSTVTEKETLQKDRV